MKIRNLGKTGLRVTELCLGTMTFGNQSDRKTSFQILDKGDYKGLSEHMISEASESNYEHVSWLNRNISKDRLGGDELVIASKCFMPTGPGPNDMGMSRKHIISAIDKTLERLGTDYLDLFATSSSECIAAMISIHVFFSAIFSHVLMALIVVSSGVEFKISSLLRPKEIPILIRSSWCEGSLFPKPCISVIMFSIS